MTTKIVKIINLLDINAKTVIGAIVSNGTNTFQTFFENGDFNLGEKAILIPNGHKYNGIHIINKQANSFMSDGLLIKLPYMFNDTNVGELVLVSTTPINIETKIINAFDINTPLFDFLIEIVPTLTHTMEEIQNKKVTIKLVYSHGKYKLIKNNNKLLSDNSSDIEKYIPKIPIDIFASLGIITKEDVKIYKLQHQDRKQNIRYKLTT